MTSYEEKNMATLLEALGALEPPQLPEGFHEEVMQSIRHEAKVRAARRRFVGYVGGFAAVAAAALALFVSPLNPLNQMRVAEAEPMTTNYWVGGPERGLTPAEPRMIAPADAPAGIAPGAAPEDFAADDEYETDEERITEFRIDIMETAPMRSVIVIEGIAEAPDALFANLRAAHAFAIEVYVDDIEAAVDASGIAMTTTNGEFVPRMFSFMPESNEEAEKVLRRIFNTAGIRFHGVFVDDISTEGLPDVRKNITVRLQNPY